MTKRYIDPFETSELLKAKHNGTRITVVMPSDIWKRDNWTCKICGCHTPKHYRNKDVANAPDLLHLVPLANGGQHVADNVVGVCKTCKAQKLKDRR